MTDDRIDVLERRLADLEGRALAPGAGVAQCTASNPHDTLAWDRKRYLCRCGKVYRKDGEGGLMEVRSGA